MKNLLFLATCAILLFSGKIEAQANKKNANKNDQRNYLSI